MEIKHCIFGPTSITNSIGNLYRARFAAALYFNETMVFENTKAPQPLPRTSIMYGRYNDRSLCVQSFTQDVKLRTARCISISWCHIHGSRVKVLSKKFLIIPGGILAIFHWGLTC